MEYISTIETIVNQQSYDIHSHSIVNNRPHHKHAK